jgi:V-type H+-transporting ATPase subunit A
VEDRINDEAQKAVAHGQVWAKVREATTDIQAALKFEIPNDEAAVSAKVRTLFVICQ